MQENFGVGEVKTLPPMYSLEYSYSFITMNVCMVLIYL